MAYKLKKQLANKANYGEKRNTSSIKYIVIHYTAGDGDTDENNGKYFANNDDIGASAHYFVDNDSVTQSVPDNYVAWSVGGNRYSNYKETGGAKFYNKCTNANSISIEICDAKKDGKIYPLQATIDNAIALTKELMKKYNIPVANVIRHFDVTGKSCPAYWCGTDAKDKKWKTEFHDKLTEKKTTKTSTTKKESTKSTASTAKKEIKVGSTVKVKKGAKTYQGGKLAAFVYERNHQVKQINVDRVVITYQGAVVAAVRKSDLTLIS